MERILCGCQVENDFPAPGVRLRQLDRAPVVDAQGRIRHHHYGEGDYEESEKVIQTLLAEAGMAVDATATVAVSAQGAQAAADKSNRWSQETYLGYEQAANFASAGGLVRDKVQRYAAPATLGLNQWSLSGTWTVDPQRAVLDKANGRIAYRFHARDLHLVLGAGIQGKPVRFRMLIDGQPPGADHGVDVDAQGMGRIDGHRLYQLIRQKGPIVDRTFQIEFLDPGAEAFAFTFG